MLGFQLGYVSDGKFVRHPECPCSPTGARFACQSRRSAAAVRHAKPAVFFHLPRLAAPRLPAWLAGVTTSLLPQSLPLLIPPSIVSPEIPAFRVASLFHPSFFPSLTPAPLLSFPTIPLTLLCPVAYVKFISMLFAPYLFINT